LAVRCGCFDWATVTSHRTYPRQDIAIAIAKLGTSSIVSRMLKISLYTLGGIAFTAIALVVASIVWVVFFHAAAPDLNIPEGSSRATVAGMIDDYVEARAEEHKFNGYVVLIEDGKPLLQKAFGFADHSHTKRLTEQSSLRLASVSKQFTAAGILLLVEQGKIALDDPVAQIIPDLPYRDVTIRHLLNQTSGIPDAYMELAQEHEEEIDILSISDAVELINKAKLEALRKPNDAYEYSNTNYILLASVIERVSDRSFEQFMSEELFQPLGMKNTRVWNLVSDEGTFPNKAEGMDNFYGDSEPVTETFLDGVAGDGAVFSSAEDFVVWDRFWYENDLISQELMAEAFEPPFLADGSRSDYGFGWIVTDKGSWHNGAWLAARSYFGRNTEDRTAVVLVENGGSMAFDEISENVRDAFFRAE